MHLYPMLVEIRLMPGKYKLKELISRVRQAGGLRYKRIIPHMSIYGPNVKFSSLRNIASTIEQVAKRHNLLPFLIDGYDHSKSDKGNVISLRVVPSKELTSFRKELCKELSKVAPSKEIWDTENDRFWFHITLSLKMSDSLFEKVWSTIHQPLFQDSRGFTIPNPYLPMDGIRIACLNDMRKIQFEYDLLQKKMLTRAEALGRSEWQKTLHLYRKQKGIEVEPQPAKSAGSIYFSSDLHLGHANIIRYCARPFANVSEMNSTLISNWNKTITDEDLVYYLGDLAYGKGSGPASYWLRKLNGRITYIGGNHDKNIPNMKNYEILKYKTHSFLLVHDPSKLPIRWDGWVIHGDKHNNNILQYPFINGKNKTINVSAELINYRPLNIEQLAALKLDTIERMDTLNSAPKRFDD